MIEYGPKLLVKLAAPLPPVDDSHASTWLLGAAFTAAIWPALGVVSGHLGAMFLGFAEPYVALQRGAVGFTAALGGALVMAPALTLVVIWLGREARVELSSGRAAAAAMALVWPAFAVGIVMVVPPLVDLPTGVGELAWSVLAILVAIRMIRSVLVPRLAVRRRWARPFIWRLALVFGVMFISLPIAPGFAVRSMLGASRPVRFELPADVELPLPPPPAW